MYLYLSYVAPPSESQIPDPAVTLSDLDKRPSVRYLLSSGRPFLSIHLRWLARTCKLQVMYTIVSKQIRTIIVL